jgi:two-component system chemotaxis response regulator CheY
VEQGPYELKPIRILIVDDLLFMRTAIREIAEGAGFLVVGEAENGREGVERYLTCSPDVVLMDITMPEMDGITALERIMTLDPSARVVMCSAMGQSEYIIRSIQCGAKDFVVKPFKPERLISAVKRAVRV